jgi:hypothetical protein
MCNISKELLPHTAKGKWSTIISIYTMHDECIIHKHNYEYKNCRNVNCNSKYCIPLFSRFKGEKVFFLYIPFIKNSAMGWMIFIQHCFVFVPLFSIATAFFLFIKINILHHYLLMLIKSNVLCWKWKIYKK